MVRFLSIALLFVSISAKAEVLPTAIGGAAMVQGIEHALDHKRAMNRAETKFQWDRTDLRFPCADAIAKAKKAGKLPKLVLNGEAHDSPYCEYRMDVMVRMQGSKTNPICLACETFDTDRKGTRASGLESSNVRAITNFMIGYDDMVRRIAAEKRGEKLPKGYGGVGYIAEAMAKPVTQRVWKANIEAFRKEFPNSKEAIDYLDTAMKSHDWSDQDAAKFRVAINGDREAAKPVVRKLMGLVAQEIESSVKDGKLDGELVPKGLGLEMAMAIHDMEKEAHDPESRRTFTNAEERTTYLQLAWRDRHMVRNFMQLYCDNLALPVPKAEVHGIVGKAHVATMGRLLADETKRFGIPFSAVDSTQLSDAWSLVVGKPKEDRTYADQGMTTERLNGKTFLVAKQMGGVRVVLLLERLEPLDGLALSSGPVVQFYPSTGPLQKMLGLKEDAVIPQRTLQDIGFALLDEYNGKVPKKDPIKEALDK